MKLIKSFENPCMFINYMAIKKFRSGVIVSVEGQAIICKDSNSGEWVFNSKTELMDYTIQVGKRILTSDGAKSFLNGNKTAGIDYLDKTLSAIEKELDEIGVYELASQNGITLPNVIKTKPDINAILERNTPSFSCVDLLAFPILTERANAIREGNWFIRGCAELKKHMIGSDLDGDTTRYGYFLIEGHWDYNGIDKCQEMDMVEITVEQYLKLNS